MRPVDKRDERHNQLAASALVTSGELGYAKSSLREIANNSEFTHGVVHQTLLEAAPMHRRWYDLRSPSMFEESLREAVTMIDRTVEQMICRAVSRCAELAGREPVTESAAAFASWTVSSNKPCSATSPKTKPPSIPYRPKSTASCRCFGRVGAQQPWEEWSCRSTTTALHA